MATLNTDFGTNLPWKGWKNGHNEWLIDLGIDLSPYVFTLNIYRSEHAATPKITLTEGDGLTNGGAAETLRVLLTQTQAGTTLPGNDYYYILSYVIDSKTYRLYEGPLTLATGNNPGSTTTSISATVTMVGAGGVATAVTSTVTMVAPASQVTANRQTASYTLILTDSGKLVEMNVADANNLTVPPNSSVAFPIGTQIILAQYGAGQTTVVAGSGVTIRSASGNLKLTGQYSGASLTKIATNEWYLFGDITA